MTEIQWRSEPTVKLVDHMPVEDSADARIVQAARVSTGADHESKGAGALLRMLIRDRHGSPFEHVVFTWRIECPLFVAREFFRHRIASYNETSGRYREMEPVFYIPSLDRPLVQTGKPGAYTFREGTPGQYEVTTEAQKLAVRACWHAYQAQLDAGVAREVARNVLPLSLFTSFYVTMNLRSFMNFASLRRTHHDAQIPTFPLYEIDQVASLMEMDVNYVAPVAWNLFNSHGRRPV